MISPSLSTPLTSIEEIQSRLSELENALVSQNPEFRTVLRKIHATLSAEPELLHLLKDEEINVIVRGIEKHSNIQIVQETEKIKKKEMKESLKNLTLDDI